MTFRRPISPSVQTAERFRFKKATLSDLAELLEVENSVWDPEQRASAETVRKRLECSDHSYLLYHGKSPKPAGSVSAVALDTFDFNRPSNWNHFSQLSQSKEHNRSLTHPKFLYVVSIGAVPGAPRGTGAALFANLLTVARENGMEGVLSGVRIPGFAQFRKNSGEDIHRYYDLVLSNKAHEPAFGAAVQSGAVPVTLLTSYYDDPDSANYAILMLHRTLFL